MRLPAIVLSALVLCVSGTGVHGQFLGTLGADHALEPGSTLLYLMPNAVERIKDPMQVRMGIVCVDLVNYQSEGQGECRGGIGKTLLELFQRIEENSTSYDIIQLIQVSGGHNATFLFTYTAKWNVSPLLPSPKPKAPK